MIFPIYTDTPVRRTPLANYGLIAINIAIHLIVYASQHAPGGGSAVSRIEMLGVLDGSQPQLYQFITYQFLHANFAHLIGNMLFLWVFGNPVNSKLGNGPYLMFYLAGGVFAATGYVWSHDNPILGASGAVASITTAYLALFPRSYITIVYFFYLVGTFELPSMFMIVFKMILWDNVLAARFVGESNVAFDAHLYGYAFGFFVSAALLALRFLPRDQFDIVALWRRWFQRRTLQTMMADPEARARAQFGRVARPVAADDLPGGAGVSDPLTDLRMRVAEALANNDRAAAAGLYERLMEMDPRQVLARGQQLEVANQLYTMQRLPQAAAAYEKYLTAYPGSPEADQVKLLLGIIYARDLQQFEVAEEHLSQLLDRLSDDRRREQCRHWLEVVRQALRGPAPGAGNA